MANESNNQTQLDLVIIGGGPAGMSAALTAGRARLSTAIINAEQPRNAVTTASHGFLTRDGVHPSKMLAISKGQLAKYTTATYINSTVVSVTRLEPGFALELAERLAIFGKEGASHYAPMISLWTNDLAVFSNGTEIGDGEAANFQANNVHVYTERVASLESEDGKLKAVVLENGDRVERDAGFISDEYSRPATQFVDELGVTSSPNDWGGISLDVDSTGKSEIEGLYVVGDARTGFSGLMASAAEGAACVEVIVHGIAAERWNSGS